MKPELFLFEIPSGRTVGDWRQTLEKRADQTPLEYDIRGQRIRLWNPDRPAERTPRPDVGYRDGIQLQRVDLGSQRKRSAIGLSICRLYFKEDSKMPAVESQVELFRAGSTPELPRHIPFLPDARALLDTFNENDPILTPLEGIHYNGVSSLVTFHFGSNGDTNLSEMARGSYSKNILGRVRSNPPVSTVDMNLALVSGFSRAPDKAKTFARAVSDVLQNEWGCGISKVLIHDHDQLREWQQKTEGQKRIMLIALDGKRGDRPSQATMEWLRLLSEEQIPFQLCSLQTNPAYARHGVACVILAKTGGLLYQVGTESVSDLMDHWCVGLDLGLGGEKDGKIAVITLTDGLGQLRAHWRALKDMDETLSEEVLRDGLGWIVSKAESLAPGRKFLAFRDGIRPKNETLEVYQDLLPSGRSCLIEISKSGNPMFIDDDVPPVPGTFGIAESSDKTFLYPASSPQQGVLTNAVKFFSPHNELNYDPNQLCEIIVALCHAPKLSFQPCSQPAPIYWANGLAGLSNSNLQFGGWSHLPNQVRDLRDKTTKSTPTIDH
jgi:hypothetical protein